MKALILAVIAIGAVAAAAGIGFAGLMAWQAYDFSPNESANSMRP